MSTPIPPAERPAGPRFLLGVDGGGTGTRARLQSPSGQPLGYGRAGPSGLGQGVAQAWAHVQQAVAAAFEDAGLPLAPPRECALGLGLAGATLAPLHRAFMQADPGYAHCVLASDAHTMLLGAHGDAPGIVVAAGTGSVAAARGADGAVRLAGGWGWPVGDEGSGAWLGLRAVQWAQAALDGRRPAGALARRVWATTGADAPALLAWCAGAGQNAYAQLAPAVFEAAREDDAAAQALLQQAADELALLAQALQGPGPLLPVALSGSIGERLAHLLPAPLRARCVAPAGDSAEGALRLLRSALAGAGTALPAAALHGALR